MGTGKNRGGERGVKFWSSRGAGSKSSTVSPVIFPQIVEHHKISIFVITGGVDEEEPRSPKVTRAVHQGQTGSKDQ
mgnify:CR=1 FL=1